MLQISGFLLEAKPSALLFLSGYLNLMRLGQTIHIKHSFNRKTEGLFLMKAFSALKPLVSTRVTRENLQFEGELIVGINK